MITVVLRVVHVLGAWRVEGRVEVAGDACIVCGVWLGRGGCFGGFVFVFEERHCVDILYFCCICNWDFGLEELEVRIGGRAGGDEVYLGKI